MASVIVPTLDELVDTTICLINNLDLLPANSAVNYIYNMPFVEISKHKKNLNLNFIYRGNYNYSEKDYRDAIHKIELAAIQFEINNLSIQSNI